MKRPLLIIAALAFLTLAAPAQAITINGGTADQQRLTRLVCYWQYPLLSYVQQSFPAFTVNHSYGARALPGSIDVYVNRTSWAYSHVVAHEFCHEVQLASDARGGYSLGPAWLDYLRAHGITDEQWIWPYDAYWGTRQNPWEALAENMRRALFLDYSVSPTTPNTVLIWLSPAAMVQFLADNGIAVWGR
jgi:hypothetical protein